MGKYKSKVDITSLNTDRIYPLKKTYGYQERDEEKRNEFRTALGEPKASHLVYVDESGMDERDNYGYGWSAKGERIHGLKAGRRQGRINMIAGYRDGQLIAPFTIKT